MITTDTDENGFGRRPGAFDAAAAFIFALSLMVLGYDKIGLPPVVIVGGSSTVGFVLWLRTYRNGALPAAIILPPFLLTAAALEIHMMEEYYTGFAPAMSRLFAISWTPTSFLLIFAFVGPALYSLTALGLYKQVPIAGFVAWFIFIGPGVAELSHFIFPILKPAVLPHSLAPVTMPLRGEIIPDMRNYWFGATRRYYFPGMYTAVLPMIPGIFGIRRSLAFAKRSACSQGATID